MFHSQKNLREKVERRPKEIEKEGENVKLTDCILNVCYTEVSKWKERVKEY